MQDRSNAMDTADYKVLIIGGGASGMFAAARLVKELGSGTDTAVIESGTRTGRKLLLTGSGRCNITNRHCIISKYNTDDPVRLGKVLSGFNPSDTVDFFENVLGVRITSKGDLYYPATFKSSTVNDALRLYIEDAGTKIITGSKAVSLVQTEEGFAVSLESGDVLTSKCVILATGGASYPGTGSDGTGVSLPDGLIDPEDIIPFTPALVPLTSDKKILKQLAGIRCSCRTKVICGGKTEDTSEGEVLFTKEGGISGICIMDISASVLRLLDSGKDVSVSLNLMQADADEAVNMLAVRRHLFGNRSCTDAFSGMIDRKILEAVMADMRIDPESTVSDLKDGRLIQLANALCGWEIPVNGCEGIDNAQVSCGGINLSALTDGLCAKEHRGLYVIGESCNVNGICGGYNLQWAWASAAAAVRDIASYV